MIRLRWFLGPHSNPVHQAVENTGGNKGKHRLPDALFIPIKIVQMEIVVLIQSKRRHKRNGSQPNDDDY
jgi:hypothetical protein